jgi:hypothetical protein
MDDISLIETTEIDNKLKTIINQTSYTKEKALEKLKEFNFDEMNVIRDYFGINLKKETNIISVNQEIYKQLRNYLDNAMSNYHKRVNKGEVKKII